VDDRRARARRSVAIITSSMEASDTLVHGPDVPLEGACDLGPHAARDRRSCRRSWELLCPAHGDGLCARDLVWKAFPTSIDWFAEMVVFCSSDRERVVAPIA
jgi:hypothetical protein